MILDTIFPPKTDEKLLRSITIDDISTLVSINPTKGCVPKAVTLLPFSNNKVKALIHEAKYQQNKKAFEILGHILNEYLLDILSEESFSAIKIIPIPLSKERLKERGYNQTLEIIKCANDFNILIETNLLSKVRNTKPQTTLTRKIRIENANGAFSTTKKADTSITYVLFDDVLTTGSTMQAAINALTKSGATRILPITIAH